MHAYTSPPSRSTLLALPARLYALNPCLPTFKELRGAPARPSHSTQGDVIVFQGEEGHEMFFLLEGRCAYGRQKGRGEVEER